MGMGVSFLGCMCGLVLEHQVCSIAIIAGTIVIYHAALAEIGSTWGRQTWRKVVPCNNILHSVTAGHAEQTPFGSGRISK